jgi:glycosyltransferase involved in cell wall biosynthesis
LGQRSDVEKLLAAADIYCQPNTDPEPFGIGLIEALYARLPVVTTAIGGACEIVDKTCGVLVSPNDASQLAESLTRLIVNRALRHDLGTGGPARANDLCDAGRQIKRLHEIFSSVCSMQSQSERSLIATDAQIVSASIP